MLRRNIIIHSEKILSHIDAQEWLEKPAQGVQNAVKEGFEAAGEKGEKLKNHLHGDWLGHALHPAITDVPIGAWTAAAVLDALAAFGGKDDLNRGADIAVGVGLLGALASAVTGLTDWSETKGRSRKIGAVHAIFNIVATGFYLASWILRRQNKAEKRPLARALSWTGYAISGASAWLGGALVFSEKVGVTNRPSQRWREK